MSRRIGITITAEDDSTATIGKTIAAVERLAAKLRDLEKQASSDKAARGIANLGAGIAAAAKAAVDQQGLSNLGAAIAEAAKAAIDLDNQHLSGLGRGLADAAQAGIKIQHALDSAGHSLTAFGGGGGGGPASVFAKIKGGFNSVHGSALKIHPVLAVAQTAISGVVAVVNTAIGAVASFASGLFGLAQRAAHMSDEMLALAERTGTSVEFVSQLGFAARQSDVDMATFSQGLLAITQRAGAMPEAFKKWGIEVTTTGGALKTTDQLVRDVANRISTLASASQRAALAQELMDEAGRKLVPLFSQGAEGLDKMAAEADRLGVTVKGTSAALGDKFNNELDKTRGVFDGLVRSLGDKAIPIFLDVFSAAQELFGSLIVWVEKNHKAVRAFVSGAVSLLADAFAVLVDVTAKLSYVAEGLISIFTTRLSKTFDAAREVAGKVSSAASKLADDLSRTAGVTKDKVVPAVQAEASERQTLIQTLGRETAARKTLNDTVFGSVDLIVEMRRASTEQERLTAETARRRREMAEETLGAETAAIATLVAQFDASRAKIQALDAIHQRALIEQQAAHTEEYRAIIEASTGRRIESVRAQYDAQARAADAALRLEQNHFAETKKILDKAEASAKESIDRVNAARAAEIPFLRQLAADANASREREIAKEIAVQERRAQAHERAAALIQAQEDRIYSAAGDGISGLMSAWDLFLRTRHQNTEVANAEILDSLASATQQAASTILSTISGLISSFRAEIARVGDIETETTQRIAIVAQETQDAYGRKVGERVERYVDHVSGEQIRALEAMGKKAEIVTETIEIKTVTAGEAVANALKSLVGSLGQIALEEIAKYLVGLGIKKLAEKTAAVSSITTAAAEGGAKAAANYAGIPFVGPPLALAAGTAMSAAIMGFTGLIPFAEGGVVTGGVPGRDSVPALLMPGERVLTVGENAAYEAGARAAGRPVTQREPAPPPAARAAAPARSSVQQTFLAFTTSRAQLDRLERDVFEPGRRRRSRNGARREG